MESVQVGSGSDLGSKEMGIRGAVAQCRSDGGDCLLHPVATAAGVWAWGVWAARGWICVRRALGLSSLMLSGGLALASALLAAWAAAATSGAANFAAVVACR